MSANDGHGVEVLLERSLDDYRRGDLPSARRQLEQVLAIAPGSFDALNLLGVVLNAMKQPDVAAEVLGRAIAVRPDSPGALNNLVMALRAMRRSEAALVAADRVVDLQPDFATGHSNRAALLLELERPIEAELAAGLSLRLRPEHALTHGLRGRALLEQRRAAEALVEFDLALSRAGGFADAHAGRADCLRLLGRPPEALAAYRQALSLNPGDARLIGAVLTEKRKLCDWSDFEAETTEVTRRAERGEKGIAPFSGLAVLNSEPTLLKAVSAWASPRKAGPRPALREHDGPVRIGYFSTDFDWHPTMLLLSEAVELHDRSRFTTTAFIYPVARPAGGWRRLDGIFDHIVDLRGLSDAEAAAAARRHGIDIAVDLDGYVSNARPGIFRERAAPIQVSYLGFAGTLGTQHFDYVVADPVTVPSHAVANYTEKVAWLPHTYQPRDRRVLPRETVPERQALGLPEQGTVFCCFNANYKITPDVFADWMAILRAVEDSVLWLLETHPEATANLRREAQSLSIAPERLVFAPKVALRDHLARIGRADLVLDTRPFNAHTTASDALFGGVPVLTLPGETFASRVAASLMHAIGLPELIATSREHYVAEAIAIGGSRERIAALKDKLARNRQTEPLFDMPAFTRYLEAAYLEMLDRHRRGLPADHIVVPA